MTIETVLPPDACTKHFPCAIPVQRLDSNCPTAIEQEDGSLIRLLPELQFYHGYQPVDLLAHVGISASNTALLNQTEVKHGGSVLSLGGNYLRTNPDR